MKVGWKCDKGKTEHISGHRWPKYTIAVSQVVMTAKLSLVMSSV